MDVKIYPSQLSGETIAVSSKTVAHRAFIISALCNNGASIKLRGMTPDVSVTVNCLTSLGYKVDCKDDVYTIWFDKDAEITPVNFEDSGATFKMLLPVIGVLGKQRVLTGKEKVIRNTENLRYTLKGCSFDREIFPLRMGGKLQAGEYDLKNAVGSQFISGLMMALPLADGDSQIKVSLEGQALQFLTMTVSLLAKFGIKIDKTDYGYYIKGNQTYSFDGCLELEGDYTNSAYFLASNYFGNSVTVKGLEKDSFQIDEKITSILKLIDENQKEIDCSLNPEILPAVAVALCYTNYNTLIKTGQKIKVKDTDRSSILIANINKLGGKAQEVDGGILVEGTGGLKGGVMVDSFGDRRIAMAMAFACTFAKEPVTILDVQSVNKAYPKFFNEFMRLGGKCTVL